MRIISNFHDYYDSVLGYGFDDSVLYKRERVEIVDNPEIGEMENPTVRRTNILIDEYGIVFFCGKPHPFVRFDFINSKEGDRKFQYVYSYSECEEIFSIFLTKKEFQEYKLDLKKKYRYSSFVGVKEFFGFSMRFEDCVLLHEKYSSPVFTWEKYLRQRKIVVNPRLLDYSFQTVLDPYTTYQEIDMFLSGVLGSPEKDMVQISDEDRKKKKGFDDMSFKPKMREKYLRRTI